LTNAFAYYGIVLVTTELFQVDDVCNGMSADFTSCVAVIETIHRIISLLIC